MQKPAHQLRLDLIDNFPAFVRAAAYLKAVIAEHPYHRIADIGGGANPMLDDGFIASAGIRYFLIDKSAIELGKAPAGYVKIEADAAGSDDVFRQQLGGRKFDLIFSHMLLEHIEDPMQVHRNFYNALNPGGRCIHIYPSPNNLPLALNRVLPEKISGYFLRVAQPTRDLEGLQKKFKAYYRMCGAPGPELTAKFEAIGYTVRQHTGYIGHDYYQRFEPLAKFEKKLRLLIHKLGLPLTSGCLLDLEKRVSGPV